LKILLPQKKMRQVVLWSATAGQRSVPRHNVCQRICLSAVHLRVPVWVASSIFLHECALGKARSEELF
jgi:hypothetical protein